MAELIMLRLEGILQSWGEDAKWDTRPTADMPSKSGVVGLISCAMGFDRDDERIIELTQNILVGVRADRKGSRFFDFQTVQGMPDLINAEGKKKSSNTIVSPHQYLQDASFLVVIQTNEIWRDRIIAAFESPRWPVYLGRKSCVPSCPVWAGVHDEYADIYDALLHYPAPDRRDDIREYEIETPRNDAGIFSRPDVPVGERNFKKRRVWHGVLREG